jgi:hypothetical protein
MEKPNISRGGKTPLMGKGEDEMKNLRIVAGICILALLGLLASRVVAQKPLLPQGDTMAATPVPPDASPQEDEAAAATVASSISYQGRLTDPDTGGPLSGTYDLRFSFWSASSGGVQLGSTITRNAQTIADGLYSTQLDISSSTANGRELWLRIQVRETGAASWETLTPRIEVLPTAYALSLRPQARISGSTARPNAIIMATNTSSGWGLRGESTEYSGYGVYGYNGSTSADTYGGGVIGVTETSGYAVRGVAPSSSESSYGGYFSGRTGVRGVAPSSGVSSYGGDFAGRTGVYGFGTGTDYLYDYGGYFIAQRRGIYAHSLNSWYAGYFDGDIYINGTVYSSLGQQTVAVNGSDETLQPGDVIAIAGIAESPEHVEPVLAVRKASGAADIAVIGVVGQAMRVQELDPPDDEPGAQSIDVQPVEGDIPPGGYLAIVTHGLAPAVKVAASPSAMAANELRVGELLTIGAVPGTVQKVETQLAESRSGQVEGAILGKVAGPYDPQTGTVPVFVTLQ